MSYILDALKKAERERHPTRVPTLTTVHSPALGARRRAGLWVVGAVLLAGGSLSIWLLRPSPSVAPQVAMAPRSGVDATPPASPAAPGGATAQPQTTAAQPSVPVTSAPADPGAGRPPESLRPPPREPAVTLLPTATPPLQASEPAGAAAPRPVEPGPVRRTPDSPGAVSGAAEPPRRPQTEPRTGPNGPQAVLAAPMAPPSLPTLGEALARMKLDIFVYTEVPKDRMVIINGRKYVEGEQVEELYLLEAITREGAVLTYQGERALLQP
ncbi:MAG: general secretion pathway protein GspB [candidate division NC10 bacterium]|nr:general secretion pathway protein GspB [candidate division NC10 bacterium]